MKRLFVSFPSTGEGFLDEKRRLELCLSQLGEISVTRQEGQEGVVRIILWTHLSCEQVQQELDALFPERKATERKAICGEEEHGEMAPA